MIEPAFACVVKLALKVTVLGQLGKATSIRYSLNEIVRSYS